MLKNVVRNKIRLLTRNFSVTGYSTDKNRFSKFPESEDEHKKGKNRFRIKPQNNFNQSESGTKNRRSASYFKCFVKGVRTGT